LLVFDGRWRLGCSAHDGASLLALELGLPAVEATAWRTPGTSAKIGQVYGRLLLGARLKLAALRAVRACHRVLPV
jgi:hypothetical protein